MYNVLLLLCLLPFKDGLKRVVIVGGGWAGYAAADALSQSNAVEVTLLEASTRSKGGLAGGYRTAGGRPVEAGLHGFWREYRNTIKIIESLGIDMEATLTPFTPSVLVSSNGKVATAPVLGLDDSGPGDSSFCSSLMPDLKRLTDLLPPPLDTALLADFDSRSPLSIVDRLSAIGLLGVWADFVPDEAASWKRYDDIDAESLFKRIAGVTDKLYDELVAPLLHVLPMAPGVEVSGAAALSCFHVFALQARGAFDVR